MFNRMMIAAVVALGTVNAANAFVSWTPSSGTGSFFTYSNGGSDTGLFGSPAGSGSVGNVFAFSPVDYTAPDNGNDSVVDRIQVTLTETSSDFDTIRVIERGSYSIVGGGSVLAQATHFYDFFQSLTNNEFSLEVTGDDSGTWELITEITIPQGVSSLSMVFENRLQATGANSSITKDTVRIEVPEPASLMLLLSALLIRRR
jgi:hypothetical protein